MSSPIFGSARTLNPEAGDHAVSIDPVEQKAAEAAVRASWREFPYYPRRYGERGWRFSLSDTGWIQTLCHFQRAESCAQVRWFAGLLASRGMPSYLLERHLVLLHEELVEVLPARSTDYARLLDCATYLRETRNAKIPEDAFEQLATQFEERVKASTTTVANMGLILVAAVADEMTGIAPTTVLENWVSDPERFDALWVGAARDTLQAARTVATA